MKDNRFLARRIMGIHIKSEWLEVLKLYNNAIVLFLVCIIIWSNWSGIAKVELSHYYYRTINFIRHWKVNEVNW